MNFLNVVAFGAGFFGCWFAKDKIIEMVTGTEAFVRTLEAKAAALRAML